MSLTWTLFAVLFALLFFLQSLKRPTSSKTKRLPPGPKGFPIFGSLHLVGKFPPRDFYELAKKHGSIMFLRLGLIPTVVVSSPQAAEQFLKTHDLNFASRPPVDTLKHIAYGQRNMAFSPYGSYWRTMRKICTLELLSRNKIVANQGMRKEELELMIEGIKEAADAGVAVDLTAKVTSVSADLTCRMVFGKKYADVEFDERGFNLVFQEGVKLAAIFNLGDYIPRIASLDLQGLTKRAKAVAKVFDDFFEKVIDEHVQSKDENRTKDFVDVMLSFMGSQETEHKIERDHVKAILLDMLVAAVDPSALAIGWTLSELFKHPEVMKRAQKELENVVGLDRMVEESDLENLEYLDMIMKEALRLHPVSPLIPYESAEDCTIDGYYIPKKSRVYINVWAIGRDSEAWTDSEKFFPERFVGSDIDLRGRHFQLLSFGSGRRICPGMQLGLIVLKLVLAQLLHCFDWKLPNGMLPSELDMTEVFGLAMHRANNLVGIPTYRLKKY
ncbi:cytochrome P450 71AU50-like [Mangifera indica]|uniref:cytochrome P450 71AU50-like n=1 Tax=Mangifera indica TaxID=29780 RepID=UPI001CFB35D3|nr:cytochrome P450 71AU50-like [Mangifera indica]